MAITFQQETLYEIVDQVECLLKMHYEEVALNRDFIKLDPMWKEYATLETMGRFIVYTARENGLLVGYSAFFINKHMHYSGTTVAINDVLFLHPDHRKSTCGYRLIKFSDEMLTNRNDINKIAFHVKLSKDWRKVLHKLGYADEEIICGKILGK